MSDFKKTLSLPETEFPMKAGLSRREPAMIEHWEKIGAREAMVAASGSRGSYVLHDGPPYANGHIHMGTALNKILKDIIVKSRNMQGFASSYVPGWDCHGLPIEHKVEEEHQTRRRNLPVLEVRRLCRDYARHWIGVQRDEFKRLGVLADWDNPYLSMRPAYEANIAGELATFVEKGSVIRANKPIYWCCSCQTALAEAEVEYAERVSPSIYVRFPLPADQLARAFPDARGPAYVLIWTTTPWTIPDNMAVCLHPDFEYALVEAQGACYVMARELAESCASAAGWQDWRVLGTAVGKALEGLVARHPLYDRPSPVVLGGHVTLDAGTGCVHTAPGHGREDHEVGLAYGLEIYSPLDDAGRFLPVVEYFAGQSVMDVNPDVIKRLADAGALVAESRISHSYPHCWRCKNPVIFRATTQWFISMDKNGLRERALAGIDNDVRWIPSWGRERIHNMVASRPDWCISRQRQWGVPIVALRCAGCGQAWNDPAWMRDICRRFAEHADGCDYWYEAPLAEVVPQGLTCPHCGGGEWKKESDILDVWFDSGSSFAAVVEARPELSFPADLYLEGSDQHRGWFQSSLLIAEGTRGTAPYRTVLTHGYVVDGEGRKMSKSVGNVIAPQTLIEKYGAEILRLWVSSVEFREDIRISQQILTRLVDAYRRIRNTCRYMLGNISDLDALLPLDSLLPLDRLALDVGARTHGRMQRAYADFELHKIFHGLHNYCVNDLSAFYFDILKDRLYADARAGHARRSAQTALVLLLRMLLRDLAPVLSFTAEEIFGFVPAALREDAPTVFALQPINCGPMLLGENVLADWSALLAARGAVTRAMEPARQAGMIGHSLDAALTLWVSPELYGSIKRLDTDLRAFFIVSRVDVRPLSDAPAKALRDDEVPQLALEVDRASSGKCERCWIHCDELGSDADWPTLCPRCAAVVRGLGLVPGEADR